MPRVGAERLSSADVSFFYLEGRTTPQHVGGLAVFQTPADGFDYEALIRLLQERISLVPRYRQKLRTVPANLANPVWVDDPEFDITYHVRRSALPRPGTDAALLEFGARIQSRPLDRDRPLWEMYLVEGLADGRFAIVTKTHHSMVDGVGAIDLAQVLLDDSPEPRRTVGAVWMPQPEPTRTDLVLDALSGLARRPAAVADAVRLGVRDVRTTMSGVTGLLRGARATASSLVPRPQSPLHVEVGQQRRLAIARTQLADYRQVRRVHGGSVHDVVLATVTGALRSWLIARGEVLGPTTSIRALVPVSVGGAAAEVSALLIDLPVGEADPLRRLSRIRAAMARHTHSGRSVSADALVALSGFAPPTLHALGARAAHSLTRRLFSLVVTNVPGPQRPLYAAGAHLTEMFPFLPLSQGQAMSVALTSYDGVVCYGITADRDATPDVALFASLLTDSLDELAAASPAELVAAQSSAASAGGSVSGEPVGSSPKRGSR